MRPGEDNIGEEVEKNLILGSRPPLMRSGLLE